MDERPDAQPVLLRIGHELKGLCVWIELPPEDRHVARPADRLPAKPSPMVLDDVVEGDDPTLPDQVAVLKEIAPNTGVPVIAINKQNVNGPAVGGTCDGIVYVEAALVPIDEMAINAPAHQTETEAFV